MDWKSWGRVERRRHFFAHPRFTDELPALIARAVEDNRKVLGVGLGRSYGDSNLNDEGAVIEMRALDRIIAFDATSGLLRVEAGASLADILQFSVPRGFFLPTTPGTRYVTIGGAVANDIHGKNHQSAGAIGRSIKRIGLVRSDSDACLETSMATRGDLFAATIGGLGLTGIIAWVEIQLVRIPSTLIHEEVRSFGNVDEFFTISDEMSERCEHTVGWIDCAASQANIGRGVYLSGNWASSGEFDAHDANPRVVVPIDGFASAFNPVSLKAFNTAYRWAQLFKRRVRNVHYQGHLFPLDGIGAWNRLYGRKGFYQYQCVVPKVSARNSITKLLRLIARAGMGSPLAVLKTFGDLKSPGMLSFPMPGATLAMDFPNLGPTTMDLMEALDAVVRDAGGRLYPAKDGRMSAAMFKAGYPDWSAFVGQIDPAFSSTFWRRVSS